MGKCERRRKCGGCTRYPPPREFEISNVRFEIQEGVQWFDNSADDFDLQTLFAEVLSLPSPKTGRPGARRRFHQVDFRCKPDFSPVSEA
jgi:hypothetical protein